MVTIMSDVGDTSVPVLALPRKMDADILMTLLYAIRQKQGKDQIKTSEQRIDDKRAERQAKHEHILKMIKQAHKAEHKRQDRRNGRQGIRLDRCRAGVGHGGRRGRDDRGRGGDPAGDRGNGVDRLHDRPADRRHGQGHRGDACRRQDRHGIQIGLASRCW